MLHDLTFLDNHRLFPPLEEAARLQKYRDNRLLFESSIYDVSKRYIKDSNTRVTRILNDYADMVAYPVDLNYHKLTSIKTADFVCGETPTITAGDIDISDIVNRFTGKLREIVIDVSRYGDAFCRAYKGDDGGRISVLDPSLIFKVVNPEDKDDVLNYVYARPTELPDSTKEKPHWELKVQVHFKGYYLNQTYAIEPCKPMNKIDSKKQIIDLQFYEIKKKLTETTETTGLKDFAVIRYHNITTSDSCYGHDDYAVLDPILAEIWARLGQIAIILDKHARPDKYAPMSAFEQDANGTWRLKAGGNTYVVNQGEQPPGYVTWDGQLAACFNELDILFEQLYQVSEMGAVYKAASGNSNISYETMKATFASALAKAKRISTSMTEPIKKAISLASQYSINPVKEEDITIDWYDGLPNDEKQEIEKAQMKITAGLSTAKRENIGRFEVAEDVAEDIDKEVNESRKNTQLAMFGNPNGEDGGGDDEE